MAKEPSFRRGQHFVSEPSSSSISSDLLRARFLNLEVIWDREALWGAACWVPECVNMCCESVKCTFLAIEEGLKATILSSSDANGYRSERIGSSSLELWLESLDEVYPIVDIGSDDPDTVSVSAL